MVTQKFGKADRDVRAKGSKEKVDKSMLSPSKRLPTTGMVGGVSNMGGNPSAKKTGPKGSITRTG